MKQEIILQTALAAIPKTTEGLREALFDEINGLRDGTTTPTRARLICQAAARIIDSIRVQIQHNKVLLEAADEIKK